MTTPRSLSPLLLAATVVASGAIASAGPAARPVPGTIGMTVREVTLRNTCTATFHAYKVAKRGDDPLLVAALTHPRILKLDFDPAHEARAKASTKRFDAWFKQLEAKLTAFNTAQEKVFADAAATPQAKAEAAARIHMVMDQGALLLDTIEIPAHIRKLPEAKAVFCDTLAEKADLIRLKGEEARGACAKVIVDAKLAPAWFTPVCDAAPAK